MEELSIVIKTFERPNCLKRLLTSIKNVCPDLKIILVDDSKLPSLSPGELEAFHLDIKYIKTEFNIGLSKGRNIGLQAVTTEYFLLLDDDFVLDAFSNIYGALKLVKSRGFDILGGRVVDVNPNDDEIEIRNFMGHFQKVDDRLICNSLNNDLKLVQCDFVLNFFIGKTASVKKVLWDEELFLLEHLDFFYRASQKGLKIYFYKDFFTFHQQENNRHYLKYRNNSIKKYSKLLRRKLGVKQIILENNQIPG